MRKLVLGIALVVCLDIAFIWMMANQPEPPEIALTAAPPAAVPVVHDSQPVDRVPEVSEVLSPPRDIVSRVKSLPAESHDRVRNPSRSAGPKPSGVRNFDGIEPHDPSLTAKHLFPDKIIVIGQSDPIHEAIRNRDRGAERSEDEHIAVAEATESSQKAKNRSLESRAFSVIKKPYLWMRALASQIR